MLRRLLPAALVLLVPFAATAADDDNPYKTAKVGDYATYKLDMKFGGLNINGSITSKVTAKTDKEATVKATGMINGMPIPEQEQKIDLTKPFDPTKAGGTLPGGGEAKAEKLKEGKEKLKVAGKEYETTWTTYKVTAKAQGMDITADVKAWMSKDIPLGMAKMEMTSNVGGQAMSMTMELTETGNKK
jgi:hypothetical protein